jgi:hypothetical protein
LTCLGTIGTTCQYIYLSFLLYPQKGIRIFFAVTQYFNKIEEIDIDINVLDDIVVLFNETYYYTSHLTQQEYEVAQLSNQFDNQIEEEGSY